MRRFALRLVPDTEFTFALHLQQQLRIPKLAKTGREILEDIHANRRVRALAPLAAMEHAIRNASRKDAERIAHAVVDTAKEWLDKPAYEKGEALGRATTAIASEVAIDVLTDGIGAVATLRKVGKVADAADRGGLTSAGRAIQKHGGRQGSAFPATHSNPAEINKLGQSVVEDILTSPGSTLTKRHHARFGDVIEVRAPDGRGVRYDAAGRFIGFLEP